MRRGRVGVEERLSKAHAFPRAWLPVKPEGKGFLTCAWEQRMDILKKDRS